jgi:hypothetical protein
MRVMVVVVGVSLRVIRTIVVLCQQANIGEGFPLRRDLHNGQPPLVAGNIFGEAEGEEDGVGARTTIWNVRLARR